ncbi:hypothetical protein QYM36_007269 [Artemia franciscana]|uniref:Uncharacterized protein n=1 Tax=Artemia franciscana TaxID=6661 RepID=A0AA88HVL9_ARTSF|nr:hypothetical protein QYM36_007269 [Artemia franciscana]
MKVFCVIVLDPFQGLPRQADETGTSSLKQKERFHLSVIVTLMDSLADFDSLINVELWMIMAEDGVTVGLIELLTGAYESTVTRIQDMVCDVSRTSKKAEFEINKSKAKVMKPKNQDIQLDNESVETDK